MVINIKGSTFFEDAENVAANDKGMTPEGIEIRHYDNLVNDISKNLIQLAGKNKYMFIEFPINELSSFTSAILYEVQLLGYIPIIANADSNSEFRRDPNKLYTFVAKGALVQIDASSLTGENGRLLRKFAVKLCKHNLVHFVSSDASGLESILSFPITVNKFFQKKYYIDFMNYLQDNAKHVRKGNSFQIRTPIKFR